MSRARDQLPTVGPQQAVQGAYAAVSALQHLPAGQQVAAASVLFLHITEVLGISPQELLDKARRWSSDADTMSFFRPEIKALKDYIKGELG